MHASAKQNNCNEITMYLPNGLLSGHIERHIQIRIHVESVFKQLTPLIIMNTAHTATQRHTTALVSSVGDSTKWCVGHKNQNWTVFLSKIINERLFMCQCVFVAVAVILLSSTSSLFRRRLCCCRSRSRRCCSRRRQRDMRIKSTRNFYLWS